MNYGTIRSLAANFAQDPDQTRYSGKYAAAVNRAQEQFAYDTRALYKDTTWTSVSGTSTHSLPADFIYEKSVTFDGLPLDPVSRDTLAREQSGDDWTDDEGTPTHYMIDPEEANKVLRLYPIPQANDADKTISMRYYPLPANVSDDSDTPLNSSALMGQFHVGIAAFTAWLLLTYEILTPEILMKRVELLKIYTDAILKADSTFKNTASEKWRVRPVK